MSKPKKLTEGHSSGPQAYWDSISDANEDKIKDQRRVEVMKDEGTKRSYHDLEIETADIPKTSIFDLPYGLELTCTRTGGWQLWDRGGVREESIPLIAGEYDDNWLRLTVGDTVIVDSRPQVEKEVGDEQD